MPDDGLVGELLSPHADPDPNAKIGERQEPDDWREWITRWLRENEVTAERVMLVAGPSPRNPKANYRIELMRLEAQDK